MKNINFENVEYAFFFNDKNWINIKFKNNPNTIINLKNSSEEEIQKIRNKITEIGLHFYTCDDDDLDKMHGEYYALHQGKKTIDFEPLEYMEYDQGHTKLFYKENNQYHQL